MTEDEAADLILAGDAYYTSGLGWRRLARATNMSGISYPPVTSEHDIAVLESAALTLGRNCRARDAFLSASVEDVA